VAKGILRKNVVAIEEAVVRLSDCGYCVDAAAGIVRAAIRPAGDEARPIAVITDLFRARPCVKFARKLARELRRCAHALDTSALLFANVAFMEYGFVMVLVVVAKVFRTLESESERRDFFEKVNDVGGHIIKSRLKAVIKVTEERIDEAFVCALAETDNEEELERQMKELGNCEKLQKEND
jgi:hypothetical protein